MLGHATTMKEVDNVCLAFSERLSTSSLHPLPGILPSRLVFPGLPLENAVAPSAAKHDPLFSLLVLRGVSHFPE